MQCNSPDRGGGMNGMLNLLIESDAARAAKDGDRVSVVAGNERKGGRPTHEMSRSSSKSAKESSDSSNKRASG